jgi:hypothetical protein
VRGLRSHILLLYAYLGQKLLEFRLIGIPS